MGTFWNNLDNNTTVIVGVAIAVLLAMIVNAIRVAHEISEDEDEELQDLIRQEKQLDVPDENKNRNNFVD